MKEARERDHRRETKRIWHCIITLFSDSITCILSKKNQKSFHPWKKKTFLETLYLFFTMDDIIHVRLLTAILDSDTNLTRITYSCFVFVFREQMDASSLEN